MCQKNYEYNIYNDFDLLVKKLLVKNGIEHDENTSKNRWERWFDFTARYISNTPRDVIECEAYSIKIDNEYKKTFDEIKMLFETGKDVNIFQSTMLKNCNVGQLFNDKKDNGKEKRRQTDFLWSCLGIHHLHIPKFPYKKNKKGFSTRSGIYLYVKVEDDKVIFIDINKHPKELHEYADLSVIKKYASKFPEKIKQFELKGIQSALKGLSNENRMEFWNKGINSTIELDEKCYMFNLGINTARTSIIAIRNLIACRKTIRNLVNVLNKKNNGMNIKNSYKLKINKRKTLAIYSEPDNRLFSFPVLIGLMCNNTYIPYLSGIIKEAEYFYGGKNGLLYDLSILNSYIVPKGIKT